MRSYKNQNQLLDDSIAALRLKSEQELEDLNAQYHIVLNSVRPSNIIKAGIKDITESQELKGTFKTSLLSLAGGYITKKLLVRKSKSFLKNIVGNILQIGVTTFIANKIDSEKEE